MDMFANRGELSIPSFDILLNNEEKLLPERLGFNQNSEQFENLGRYEGAAERSLFKSIHELQRLQAIRLGDQGLWD